MRLPNRKLEHVFGRPVVEGTLAGQGRQFEYRLHAIVVLGTGGEEAAFGDAGVFGDEEGGGSGG